MAEVPLGAVEFKFTGLGDRVAYEGKRSHHWYDTLYSVFATVLAYLRGWRDPKVAVNAKTVRLTRKGTQVGPMAVREWASYLQHKRPEGRPFTMVENWICPSQSKKLADNATAKEVREAAYEVLKGEFKRAPNGGLLFIPLVIGQGLLEVNHIVWVAADLKTRQVEYYDSKGVEIGDDGGTNHMVAGVIAAMMFVSGFKEVVQNPVRHQYDIHNCGVLGMCYLSRRRRVDKTFAEFCLGKGADLGEIRTWMAKEMLENPSPFEEELDDGSESLMNF